MLLAAAALAAAGPLGAGRLAGVGPAGWQVGLAGGLEVAVGAAGFVGFEYLRDWWQEFRAERAIADGQTAADPADPDGMDEHISADPVPLDRIPLADDTADQPTEPVRPVVEPVAESTVEGDTAPVAIIGPDGLENSVGLENSDGPDDADGPDNSDGAEEAGHPRSGN